MYREVKEIHLVMCFVATAEKYQFLYLLPLISHDKDLLVYFFFFFRCFVPISCGRL